MRQLELLRHLALSLGFGVEKLVTYMGGRGGSRLSCHLKLPVRGSFITIAYLGTLQLLVCFTFLLLPRFRCSSFSPADELVYGAAQLLSSMQIVYILAGFPEHACTLNGIFLGILVLDLCKR